MSTDLVVQGAEIAPTSTLFGTDNPAEVVQRAAVVAKSLADLVRKQNLIVRIGQSDHVRVEGWTLLGSMLGVFPIVEWTRPVMVDEQKVGWEARVTAQTRGGEIVGSAEAECLRDERTWKSRDDYALRSMAQTRAVSKALRLPLGFVMQLAGFDPTPADEMPVYNAPPPRSAALDDPAVPFGDAPAEQLQPRNPLVPSEDPPVIPTSEGAPNLTAAQAKKLNVLVGKLRPDHISTLQLWQSMGREPVTSEDGTLHWSPLRDSLSKSEASGLIDRLERFAKDKLAEGDNYFAGRAAEALEKAGERS